MAFSKLSCPECGTTLRPAKPVAAGKKVKCPSCETIFVAGEDEDEVEEVSSVEEVEDVEEAEERPRGGKSKKNKSKKSTQVKEKEKKKEEPAKKAGGEEETYGYIKDPDLDDEEKRPKISHAPDTSVKDLRGPAILKLTDPANKLQLVGAVGFIGWTMLLVMVLIPNVFPVKMDDGKKRPVMVFGPGLAAVNPGHVPTPGTGAAQPPQPPQPGGGVGGPPKEKYEEEKGGGFWEVYGMDLGEQYLIFLALSVVMMVYTAVVVSGGIQMGTLESRTFAMVGAIMSMLPVTIAGLCLVFSIIIKYGLGLLMDDADYIFYVMLGMDIILWLGCIAVGVWCILTLNDEDVIVGFEYDPE